MHLRKRILFAAEVVLQPHLFRARSDHGGNLQLQPRVCLGLDQQHDIEELFIDATFAAEEGLQHHREWLQFQSQIIIAVGFQRERIVSHAGTRVSTQISLRGNCFARRKRKNCRRQEN